MRLRSLNLGKAIALVICPIICLLHYLARALMYGMRVCVRSKDAQKQLARTSLKSTKASAPVPLNLARIAGRLSRVNCRGPTIELLFVF